MKSLLGGRRADESECNHTVHHSILAKVHCTKHTWQQDASVGNIESATPAKGSHVALDLKPIAASESADGKGASSFTRRNEVICSLLSGQWLTEWNAIERGVSFWLCLPVFFGPLCSPGPHPTPKITSQKGCPSSPSLPPTQANSCLLSKQHYLTFRLWLQLYPITLEVN